MDAAWKQDVNDKVAAARARRQAGRQNSPEQTGNRQGEVIKPGQADSRAARVAAAVAARYAQAPSYSEYLATEVRTAMMAAMAAQEAANEAHAAAESAARQARAMQAALQAPVVSEESAPSNQAARAPSQNDAPRVDYAATGIPNRPSTHDRQDPPARSVQTPITLSDPLEDAILEPATPLPAKLLEFPRELVAARKARPRHAEGPLRDEPQDEPQLRIFEVEPEASAEGNATSSQAATEWSSIRLDAYPASYEDHAEPDELSFSHPSHAYSSHANSARPASERRSTARSSDERSTHLRPLHAGHLAQPAYYALRDETAFLKVASLSDRLMAGIVDCALVGIAYLLFVLVFTSCTAHPPTGRPAVIGSALLIGVFYLVYQFLFFTFSNGTPGMLYARIALCTFEDDNPTRDAMRKRILALILAAMPLGLGFLYAIFDEDHLGWHDRMTRIYQRSYK